MLTISLPLPGYHVENDCNRSYLCFNGSCSCYYCDDNDDDEDCCYCKEDDSLKSAVATTATACHTLYHHAWFDILDERVVYGCAGVISPAKSGDCKDRSRSDDDDDDALMKMVVCVVSVAELREVRIFGPSLHLDSHRHHSSGAGGHGSTIIPARWNRGVMRK